MDMSLLDEMNNCNTVDECVETATIDAHDYDEQVSGWFTCIEEMFGKYKTVYVFDEEVRLKKFDFAQNNCIVAICQKEGSLVKVAFESIKFKKLTKQEQLWFDAWKQWSK